MNKNIENYKKNVTNLCRGLEVDKILEKLNQSETIDEKEKCLKSNFFEKVQQNLVESSLNYDFSNDGANDEYMKLDKDGLKKFFVYMALRKKYKWKLNEELKDKEFRSNPDPDSYSQVLQEIYKILWVNGKTLDFCKYNIKGTEKIAGETMNSVNTTLNYLYEQFMETKEQENERRKTRQNMSIRYLLTIYDKNSAKMNKQLKEIVTEFLKVYHTIGNFLPFPIGCNGPRGTGPLKDYWDLTLMRIYNYYEEKEKIDNVFENNIIYKNSIYEVVGAEHVVALINWLENFNSWNSFVKKNYMQDFVKIKSIKNNGEYEYGEPMELWDNHFNKEDPLPILEEECKEYFNRASKLIKIRGVRMILELYNNI